jgi:hypothetical protein
VPVAAVATVTPRRNGSTDKIRKARIVAFGDSDFASNTT